MLESVKTLIGDDIFNPKLEALEYIDGLCQTNPLLSRSFCLEYALRKSIYEDYMEYFASEELEDKKFIFQSMQEELKILEELESVRDNELDTEEQTLIKTADNVLIIYLYDDEEKCTYIEKFIEEYNGEKFTQIDLNHLVKTINLFKLGTGETTAYIHVNSSPVLKEYNTKSDKRRISNAKTRTVFRTINSNEISLTGLDYQCILIVTAGHKKGEHAIYDYVNTQNVNNAIEYTLDKIKKQVDSITYTSEKDRKEKIEQFIKELNRVEEQKFLEFYDRMKQKFQNRGENR